MQMAKSHAEPVQPGGPSFLATELWTLLGSHSLSHRPQTTLLLLTAAEENIQFMKREVSCAVFACRASLLRE